MTGFAINRGGLGYWYDGNQDWFINANDADMNTLCLDQNSVYTTNAGTTTADIIQWIYDSVYKDRRAFVAFRIYDDYNKIFGEAGNWMCYGWFQDHASKVVIAVNHWTASMKIMTIGDGYTIKHIRTVQLV